MTLPIAVDVPRSRCGGPPFASTREWLVTNGTGSYAMGTIDGALTRTYHGLLVAALEPPAGRRLLVAKSEETATYAGIVSPLSCDRWRGDAGATPLRALERFRLEGSVPVWTFALGDASLERRLTMRRGRDATVVRYTLARASAPVDLELRVLAADRDFGDTERMSDAYAIDAPAAGSVRVRATWSGARATFVRVGSGELVPQHTWYRDFALAWEAARGLAALEDHLHVATWRVRLAPGETCEIEYASAAADAAASPQTPADAFAERAAYDAALLERWQRAQPRLAPVAPPALRALVLAADAFVTARPIAGALEGRAILAGYPWFGEWGRDMAISLPGLTFATGRLDDAHAVLLTFGRHLDGGMLPNDFPNTGAPGYNSVDAPLWYVEAVRAYADAAGADDAALPELARICLSIAEAYLVGTRYGIGADPADGLMRAGEPGVQLTWMDAKVDGWVVTPRSGKPVEISALWYNALRAIAERLAAFAGRDAAPFAREAERVRASFARFDGGHGGGLHDVLDGPGGNDPSLRPNQIFAVSLAYSPLSEARAREIVALCGRELLTSHGLRTLAPGEPAYIGRYAGDRRARDGAYHQGTVWPWLIGPFAMAHARVYGDRAAARGFLAPLLAELDAFAVGTLAEIADGDAPFRFDGAIAQAWSVAEVLRAWHALADPDDATAGEPRS